MWFRSTYIKALVILLDLIIKISQNCLWMTLFATTILMLVTSVAWSTYSSSKFG